MKKLTALLLSAILALGFTACGSSAPAQNATEDKTVVIGVDDTFAPMGFRDEAGNLVGFDIDLANELLGRLGYEPKFQVIDWSMKETELENGNIDLIWNGYTITDSRKEKVNFTQAYLDNKQIIVTMADSEIESKADLADKTVAVQKESSAYEAVMADTATSATLKFKIKFNDISQVNAWGYGFMPCISNGEGGAVLAQRNVGNSTLTWVTFVGNTYENTNVSYEKNTWYVVELTLANGKQSAKVNGTYIYQNKDLSTRSEHLANNIVARTNTNTQYTFNADIEYIQYIEE